MCTFILVHILYWQTCHWKSRARTEQVLQQQEAAMAIQDRVQAAVDQHVAAATAAHAEELAAVQQQMQQTLDRRAQVGTAAFWIDGVLTTCSAVRHASRSWSQSTVLHWDQCCLRHGVSVPALALCQPFHKSACLTHDCCGLFCVLTEYMSGMPAKCNQPAQITLLQRKCHQHIPICCCVA